jgi:uncharacterized protein YjbJ (UPF0337 family)
LHISLPWGYSLTFTHTRIRNGKEAAALVHVERRRCDMTRQQSNQRWNAMKIGVRQRWSRLSDAQLDYVRGNLDRLVAALQQSYGYDRRMAEREITNWRNTMSRVS